VPALEIKSRMETVANFLFCFLPLLYFFNDLFWEKTERQHKSGERENKVFKSVVNICVFKRCLQKVNLAFAFLHLFKKKKKSIAPERAPHTHTCTQLTGALISRIQRQLF